MTLRLQLIKCIRVALPLFFLSISYTHADLIADLVLSPQNPGPYQAVTVTLTSYDFDVDSADISWTINGKAGSSGPGLKQIRVNTGPVGSVINVATKAKLPNGQLFQAVMTVTPASVDLVWESPESYVPPFYEGRSLPGEGAQVRVTATPYISSGGKIIAPENISYAWYKNDEFLDTDSGRGKQALNVNLEYLTDVTTIKVIARTGDGLTATKSIDIYPHDVRPVFYLYDPVLGLDLTNAILKRFETTKEFTLKLVPYFFSLNNGAGAGATFSWDIDGLPIVTEDDTTVTLRPKDGAYGSRMLGVAIANSTRILQTIETSINVVFDTRNE